MILKEYDLSVRLPQERAIDTGITLVQNDKDVYKFNVRIFDGVNEIDYTDVDEATITFLKSDKNVVQGDMAVEADKLSYVLGTNEIAYPGWVQASVQLLGATERLSTAKFVFRVESDLVSEKTVKSTSEFPLLQRIAEDVGDIVPLLPDIEQTVQNFPGIQNFFDTAAVSEAQRGQNETTRQTQEAARQASIADIEDRFEDLTAQQQQDAEVVNARDGETSLNARLNRDKDVVESHLAEKANKSELEATNQSVNVLSNTKVGSGILAQMGDLSQEVKEAMTGGSVAVVGEGAVTMANLSSDVKSKLDDISNKSTILNNISINGDFNAGLDGWEISNITANLTDGGVYLKDVVDGTSSIRQIIERKEGHIYFLSAVMKSENSGLYFFANGFASNLLTDYDGSNEVKRTSLLYTAPSSGVAKFGFGFGSTNPSGKSAWIDEFVVIDLTQDFGLGNEPSKEEMDFIINELGWFDGQFNNSIFSKKILEDNKRISKLNVYPKMTNLVNNGNFENDINGWSLNGFNALVDNEVCELTKIGDYGDITQTLLRVQSHTYYIATLVSTKSNGIRLVSNGGGIGEPYYSNGLWKRLSTLMNAPSSTSSWKVGIDDPSKSNEDKIKISKFVVIDLTQDFGLGNEPSKEEMDNILDIYFDDFFDNAVDTPTIENSIIDTKKEIANSKSFIKNNVKTGIEKEDEIYPVMFGVKMTNSNDSGKGVVDRPRPIGWLYYHPQTYDLYYADGDPKNMKFLCHWKREVTWNGSSSPRQYRPFITKYGDIIFVWRGDLLGTELDLENVRQNPIVYTNGDFNNPVEVDLGEGLKPTSWLQNCGADYIYNKDIFLFAEYTRPSHATANIWRVTRPITNPDNWNVVKSVTLSGDVNVGMKHFHTINYDTYSGKVFASTGDDDSAAKILMSNDYGVTWDIVLENDRSYARVLNFVFTKDYVYWANDDNSHYLNYCPRDANGVPDFTQRARLCDLSGHPPTYATVLIEEPHGLLILNRYDSYADTPVQVLFWDLEGNEMHVIKEIMPAQEVIAGYGFRMEAVNWYCSRGNNKIVVGFGEPQNRMDILNNLSGPNVDRINNLVLEVIKSGAEYNLKVSAISDRS